MSTLVQMFRSVSKYSNCGIGPGGFEPGNDCAKGGHTGLGMPHGKHTPEGQKKLIHFLEKTTGEKFDAHGSVSKGNISEHDIDIIHQAKKFRPNEIERAMYKLGFKLDETTQFLGGPVLRFKNAATGHKIEIWSKDAAEIYSRRGSRSRYTKSLHEMIQHAYHQHASNAVRDMTHFEHGMSAEDVAKLLADQPGNKGKTADEMRKKWVASEKFVPMKVPVQAVHPVRVPTGRTESKTVGPIVIDDNFRGVEQLNSGSSGFKPQTLIIDGQHRHNDAKNRGEQWMNAVVGEKAVPKVNAAMIRLGMEGKLPSERSGDVEKLSRRLCRPVVAGPQFFNGEWF